MKRMTLAKVAVIKQKPQPLSGFFGLWGSVLLLATNIISPAMAQATPKETAEEPTLSKPSKSKPSKTKVDFSLLGGIYYDSNVSVNELDSTTREGDSLVSLKARVKMLTPLTKRTDFKLGYSFSQSLHETFSAFDIQSHLASAELVHDFDSAKAGLAYRYSKALLDGRDFLSINQVSPSLSGFFTKKLYGRVFFNYADKRFDTNPVRDSHTNSGGGDIYWFLDGTKRYWLFGIAKANENALASEFDYESVKVKVKFQQRVNWTNREVKMALSVRAEARDYSSPTPSIGVNRSDDRLRIKAELEYPFSQAVFTRVSFEHAEFDSNLPSANYQQNMFGLQLGRTF